MARRQHRVTRGALIAWAVSFALGVGWVLLLEALPSGFEPVATLFLALVGIFGFGLGLLMATGWLVRVMRPFGNPTRAFSSPVDELPADRVFGIIMMLFCLPSLFVYFGG